MLELREITKRFGDVLANDHVNIVVKPGTIHAIVGENGAGKSTANSDCSPHRAASPAQCSRP